MTGVGGEAARKSVHVLLSLVVAGLLWRLPHLTAAALIAGATALALAVEALRLGSPSFGRAFAARLGPLLRTRETTGLTGATTLALGYTVAAVAVPGVPALAGVLFTGIGDAVAAVVGRRWGRHRYPGGKSVEGSLTFLAVAFGLCLLLGASAGPAALIAVALTLLEAPSLRVDDNLYLPVVGAAIFGVIAGL